MKSDLVNKTLLEIKSSIGNVEGKIDGINKRLDRMNGTLINHEDRINQGENERGILNGEIKAIAILGTIIAIFVSIAKIFAR